jgi:hypothetical protein
MGGWTYEQVDAARVSAGIPLGDGLSATQLAVIAQTLGMQLHYDSTPNPVSEDGIFAIRWGAAGDIEPTLHAVYLQDGWIYDPGLDRPLPWVLWFEAAGGASQFLYVLKASN